uniref:Olfactory receptor C family, x1 n=1 Tax=Scleropages formosus TaxID=113540 RepID=A0A8C9V7C4_SCLFO
MEVVFGEPTLTKGTCVFQGKVDDRNLYEEGDIVIGGLFPLHYGPVSFIQSYQKKPEPTGYKYFSARALRWMQTMAFAIEEINQRQDFLPHLKLGYHILDSCDDIPVSLRNSLILVSGLHGNNINSTCAGMERPVSPVIIGDAASGVSMAVLRTLGSFQIPLVSYFASCNCLSNKKEFPTFMRIMPSDAFQIKALVKLIHYFQWTWVGVIGVDSDYARFAIQLFLEESSKFGVCAAYVHLYPVLLSKESVNKVVQTIKRSSAKVILNFSGESELQSILRECGNQNVMDIQWIASEAWSTAKSLWKEFHSLLKGTLGFAIRKAEIPGLQGFLTQQLLSRARKAHFLAELWEEIFDCKLNESLNDHVHGKTSSDRRPCSAPESLNSVFSEYWDVSQLRVSSNVYKAVYLIAHALHDLSACVPGAGPFADGSCADPIHFLPWQVSVHFSDSMRQASFNTLGEEVSFDKNGDPIASYDLMNWQEGPSSSLQLVKVGYYDASLGREKDLVVNDSTIWWHRGHKAPLSMCSESCFPGFRKANRKGEPVCCFDCIPCAEGEISNETDSADCRRCSIETWSNQARNQCVPKAIEFLSYQESMGMVLCAGSVFGVCVTAAVSGVFIAYRTTPVVRANNMELSFLLLLFLAVCFLVSLMFIEEPTDWLCRIRYTTFGISFSLCTSCILAKTVVVLMAFRSTLPGNSVMRWFGPAQQRASVFLCTSVQVIICLVWLTTRPPQVVYNTRHQSAKIIMECMVGSEVGFWCVLGYIGFLACLCFVMAFLARKLPDNFNEAKFITFSMLIFFAVWITFIPVYMSTSGKYMVAVHVFAILASAFGILLCIFAPKCFIVLLKPERNTRRQIMLKNPCLFLFSFPLGVPCGRLASCPGCVPFPLRPYALCCRVGSGSP